MTLRPIQTPEAIDRIPISKRAARLIDAANDRIEAFMLADQAVIESFVNCDFDLFDQALAWIQQNHLLAGNRFCELGSGFGVAAMLASLRGMESVGIEIEPLLVAQSSDLAEDLDVAVDFYCGSFIPADVIGMLELESDLNHIEMQQGDVYRRIGLAMNDFDLFFAFPWPGEHHFFEAVFDACAADGALLLTYRGRDGMNLLRKL